jgi:hypothetical protein
LKKTVGLRKSVLERRLSEAAAVQRLIDKVAEYETGTYT